MIMSLGLKTPQPVKVICVKILAIVDFITAIKIQLHCSCLPSVKKDSYGIIGNLPFLRVVPTSLNSPYHYFGIFRKIHVL